MLGRIACVDARVRLAPGPPPGLARLRTVRAQLLGAEADTLVIPLPHGPVRGRAVSPIHPLAPAAAARDPRLHRMLALVDTFRVGRARERAIAARELRACL
jgi:hypothetical protein